MDQSKIKIALIEDDANLRFLVKKRLQEEGYEVVETDSGNDAVELVLKEEPGLILLDWMLPGKMGDVVAQELRGKGYAQSIIMITAKGQDEDKIEAYGSGVTDYITKPFNMDVLLALIDRKVLFHKQVTEKKEVLKGGPFTHHPSIHLVEKDGKRIELTILENRILYFFLQNQDVVVDRDDLIKWVWGYSSDINTRTLDMHIVRLRKKIEENPESPVFLETMRGVGYKFNSRT